ncbi:MAG: hypothetical protein JXX29_22575, partial [Deltaproteobacteria bacterium]|nr:hypothetical protein [Deltaproteobacteria bacterium]
DTDTDTDELPLVGIWVSRAPGLESSYDVLELSPTDLWESASLMEQVSSFSAEIDSFNSDSQYFHLTATSGESSDNNYVSYTTIDEKLYLYYHTVDYPNASGGIEGIDYYVYTPVSETECRRYMARADVAYTVNSTTYDGVLECGFSADTLSFYCTQDFDVTTLSSSNGYDSIEAFVSENRWLQERFSFRTWPDGMELSIFDEAGKLLKKQGAGNEQRSTLEFTNWDSLNRPIAGTLRSETYDCNNIPVTIEYDDDTRTVTQTTTISDGIGADCENFSNMVEMYTYDEDGDVSEMRIQTGSSETLSQYSNKEFGIACTVEMCPLADSIPTPWNGTYTVTFSGQWEGTATLRFEDGAALLEDINGVLAADNSYGLIYSSDVSAYCIRQYGDEWVLAFMMFAPVEGTDGEVMYTVQLRISAASQDVPVTGTFIYYDWRTGWAADGSQSGTISLSAL